MTQVQPPATPAAPSFEPVLSIGESSLVGGIVGGLIGAIAATALWYGVVVVTEMQIGLVAIAVGFIVARAALFGAGGRGSIPLVAVSALLTLSALVVSEYLILYHFIGQAFGTDGLMSVVQPPDVVIGLAVESVMADPLTLVFWGIALFQAVAIPFAAINARSAG